MKGNTDRQISALTGLRAVAALIVFASHHVWWYGGGGAYAAHLKEMGVLGVSIFFTLSGFLITRSYYGPYVQGQVSFGEYWYKRFIRIFPAYLFLLAVFYFLVSGIPPLPRLLANVTLTQGYFSTLLYSGLTQAWSLTVEETFYVLAPLIFFAIGRRPAPVRVALVVGGVAFALHLIGQAALAYGFGGDFLKTHENVVSHSICGRFFEFGIGILAAFWMQSRRGAGVRVLTESGTLAFAVLVALSVSELVRLGEVNRGVFYLGGLAPEAIPAFWLASLGTVALIGSATAGSRVAHALLGNPVAVYLGKISYVFYLIQQKDFFFKLVSPLERVTGLTASDPLAALAFALLISAVVYECVEKPARTLLLRWTPKKAPPTRKPRSRARVVRARARAA